MYAAVNINRDTKSRKLPRAHTTGNIHDGNIEMIPASTVENAPRLSRKREAAVEAPIPFYIPDEVVVLSKPRRSRAKRREEPKRIEVSVLLWL